MASNFGPIVVRVVLIAPLIGVWLVLHPAPRYACSCVLPGPPSEELAKSTAVFMGQVVSVRESDSGLLGWSSSDPSAPRLGHGWPAPYRNTAWVWTELRNRRPDDGPGTRCCSKAKIQVCCRSHTAWATGSSSRIESGSLNPSSISTSMNLPLRFLWYSPTSSPLIQIAPE